MLSQKATCTADIVIAFTAVHCAIATELQCTTQTVPGLAAHQQISVIVDQSPVHLTPTVV